MEFDPTGGYGPDEMMNDALSVIRLWQRNQQLARRMAEPTWFEKQAISERKNAIKQAIEAEHRQRTEEIDKQKFVVGKLIDLHKGASTDAEREHYYQTIKSVSGGLDNTLVQALRPILEHGPTGTVAEKERQYVKEAGARPQITIDPNIDKRGFAEQQFAASDWDVRRQIFISGKESAPTPKKFLALGEGAYALRDDDGVVSLLSESELSLRQLAKDNNTTVAKIMADGGRIYGTKIEAVVNGSKVDIVPWVNVTDIVPGDKDGSLKHSGSYKLDKSGVMQVIKGSAQDDQTATERMNMANDITDIMAKKTDSRVWLAIKGLMDNDVEQGVAAKTVLQQRYPGYWFNVKDTKPARSLYEVFDMLVDSFSDATLSITAVPGTAVKIPTADVPLGLVQDRFGIYRTEHGKILPKELVEQFGSMKLADIKTLIKRLN